LARKVEFLSSLKKLFDRVTTDPYDLFVEALAAGFEDGYEDALETIDKALYLSKTLDDPEKRSLFLVFKATALNRLKRDTEALDCIEEAIKLEKKDPFSWNIKGDLLHGLGKYEEALTAYENSIKYSEKDELPESLVDKAEILFHLERDKQALRTINESLELDPKNADAWDIKSDILSELGKNEEAFEAANKGLSIDSEHSDLLIDKGVLLMNEGKNDEALSLFNKVIQIENSDELAWYNKACVLSILNKKEDSLDALTVATALDQENIINMNEEKDFGNIKNTERFKRLVSQEV